jgi:hypothetical protein
MFFVFIILDDQDVTRACKHTHIFSQMAGDLKHFFTSAMIMEQRGNRKGLMKLMSNSMMIARSFADIDAVKKDLDVHKKDKKKMKVVSPNDTESSKKKIQINHV